MPIRTKATHEEARRFAQEWETRRKKMIARTIDVFSGRFVRNDRRIAGDSVRFDFTPGSPHDPGGLAWGWYTDGTLHLILYAVTPEQAEAIAKILKGANNV